MQWQPIETAPKVRDTKVLTWGRIPESYGYHPEEWLVSVSQWCGNGWSSQASLPFGNSFQPTHWMPLPAPPDTQRTDPQDEIQQLRERVQSLLNLVQLFGGDPTQPKFTDAPGLDDQPKTGHDTP